MSERRFAVLALAHARSPWFAEVARWATVGSLPIDFVGCVSADELRARLAAGRPYSAALLDGRLPAVDRDLVDRVDQTGCAVLVVGHEGPVDWAALGAAAVLPTPLARDDLLAALVEHGAPMPDLTAEPAGPSVETEERPGWRGRLVGVTGRGGTGRSTVAIGLAQALATDPRHAGAVLLADLALDAGHGALHDAGDVVPGVQELVEAHRTGRPSAEQVRACTFDVVERGYRLLLGLRRHRDWAAIRPRAWDAALDGMLGAHRVVVAEVDADLEGEPETGSFDVEDRNRLARSIVARADVLLVVGRPDLAGVHGLVQVVHDVLAAGSPPDRVVAVVNGAPRSPRVRSEVVRAFAELVGPGDGAEVPIGPVFLPRRRAIDALHRDGAPLPATLTAPLLAPVHAVFEGRGARAATPDEPLPVAPGSLGHWSAAAEATP